MLNYPARAWLQFNQLGICMKNLNLDHQLVFPFNRSTLVRAIRYPAALYYCSSKANTKNLMCFQLSVGLRMQVLHTKL